MLIDLDAPAVQSVTGQIVGVSQQAISAMVAEGKLPGFGTQAEMIQAYCERLREQAAGRLGGEVGGLDLVQERAALAKEQRIRQRLLNDVARREYSPVGALTDVLGMASGAVVDRFDQLEAALKKSCPTLADDAKATVMQVIASARNEWIKSTARLVDDFVEAMVEENENDDQSLDSIGSGSGNEVFE